MHLKLLDAKPRKEDENFQKIAKELEECDAFMVITLRKTKEGTQYKKHFYKIRAEEIVYAAELVKTDEVLEIL
jgi:hypothetical protein